MFRVFGSLALVIAALIMLSATPARADTAADCGLSDLRSATESATFEGRNAAKDQAGLLGKLDSAITKLEQGKTADALQALTQFRDKAATLGAQGKLAPADAETLVTGAEAAIACLSPA